MIRRITRRSFLALSITSAGIAASSKWLKPAQARSREQYNLLAIQSGDVTANSAVIWGRGNSESRLVVDFSTSSTFEGQVKTRIGPLVSAETDYTGTIDLQGLRPNTTYYYQVRFVDGSVERWSGKLQGLTGRFRTAPSSEQAHSVRFVWAADMAGQGWGRNPNLKIQAFDGEEIQGGYVIFDVMRKLEPDFALFSGDMIYADNAIPPTKAIPGSVGGGTWVNEPAKDFIAISLDEFRENWKYNLGDSKFARFLAETPIYVQWDDHEVTNNWYPNEILTAAPYNGLRASELAERAKQAFFEYNPIRGEEIFRNYNYGKHLELFLLDERSFRGDNDKNIEPSLEMLGEDQLQWIKDSLKASRATWKVIASDDPLSIVTGGAGDYDAWSQDDSRVLGREAQLSELLKFIKDEEIENVVWITADVHFPAAIYYDPSRAVFQDFNPFWEFVIGPIHAGAFGPAGNLPLDPSFGPEYEFKIFPDEPNLPPPNNQFFGSMDVDGKTAQLTARIHDITGKVVYEKVLNPNL
jgi:alkaline phosphatase D